MRIQCFLTTLFCLALLSVPVRTQTQTDIRPLSVGQPIERELKGGEVHSYSIAVTSGQYLHVVVDQRGIDVVATLFSPDGKKLVEVDSPDGTHGPEPISTIVETTGSYRLEVRSLETMAAFGRYQVKLEELRAATGKDPDLVAGEQAYLQAELFRAEGTAESLQRAFKKYEEVLAHYRAGGDRVGEALALSRIGFVYRDVGDEQKALEFYGQALLLSRSSGDRVGEAMALNGIGLVYSALDENEQALRFFNELLPLTRITGNKSDEAYALINAGFVYFSLGKNQQALKFYKDSLPLFRAIDDKSGESTALDNMGTVYRHLGENQQALKVYKESLLLSRSVGDTNGEAATLANIGVVYHALGDQEQALKFYKESLPFTRIVGDKSGEAQTLDNLKEVYLSVGNPRLAIFYGKQAVNAFQRLRSNIQGLDKDIQKTYLKSIEQTYRDLAGVMIGQGRFTEAQQVLNIFKDQQFFDVYQTQQKQLPLLKYTPREEVFARRYESLSKPMVAVAEPSQQLAADLKTARGEFSVFLKQAESDFSRPHFGKDKVGEITDTKNMQRALRDLQSQTGQNAVAVYTVADDENYRVLLITPKKIDAVSYPIKAAELRKKAIRLFGQLSEINEQTGRPKAPIVDVQKSGKELFDILFAPVAAKLRELGLRPDVLMWSLDGALRYLPVAALYDGKQYMAESYRNVVFTRADAERLLSPVSPTWTGSGFYNSREYSLPVRSADDGTVKLVGFDGLKNVKTEVEAIFGVTPNRGIIGGGIISNEQFTKESMFKTLELHRPLVHIASHFKFEPGDASASFLLLGDGTQLTLEDIKNAPDDLFKGVELLTLSACETGIQRERESDGREIDGFAELAQRKGAKAVIASLWKVDDESTSQLMTEFYQTRQGQKLTKTETLQKAQLSLLKSKVFSHPYYWAPFILIGNWR